MFAMELPLARTTQYQRNFAYRYCDIWNGILLSYFIVDMFKSYVNVVLKQSY